MLNRNKRVHVEHYSLLCCVFTLFNALHSKQFYKCKSCMPENCRHKSCCKELGK